MKNQAIENNEVRDVLDTDNSVLFRKSYSALLKYANKKMPADLKKAVKLKKILDV
jgi:hypothetical protein